MTAQPRLFREVTLRSAIKVMREAGLDIAGAEITADGTVRVLTSASPALTSAPTPTLTAADDDEDNPFDRRWAHRNDRAKA